MKGSLLSSSELRVEHGVWLNDPYMPSNHAFDLMKTFFIAILINSVTGFLITSIAFAEPKTISAEITMIYLLRHTEKALEIKQDPPLTKIGEQRARYWANALGEVEFEAIYSTDTIRTRDTAKPTANANKKHITLYKPGTLTRDDLLERHAGKNILIVGHSNTIPVLSNKLIQRESFNELDEKDYSSLFIVTLSGNASKGQKLNITLPSDQ